MAVSAAAYFGLSDEEDEEIDRSDASSYFGLSDPVVEEVAEEVIEQPQVQQPVEQMQPDQQMNQAAPAGLGTEAMTAALLKETQEPSTYDQVLNTVDSVFGGAPSQMIGIGENLMSMGTGIAGTVLGGISGLMTAGDRDASGNTTAGDISTGIASDLAYQPRTETGQAIQQGIGSAIESTGIGGALESSREFLGDEAFEATGSPELGAMAYAIPDLFLTALPAGIARVASKVKTGSELTKALDKATPTSGKLKESARVVYDDIDNLGATVKPESLANLTESIEAAAKSVGASRLTTQQAYGVIDEFKKVVESGKAITLRELDELRTVAQNSAKAMDPSQKAPAVKIIDEIDSFLDDAGSDILNLPKNAPNVGEAYKSARQMWGRARKSELIQEVMENADLAASGVENGYRMGFRSILKNKKQSKFFTPKEKAAMREVVDGTKTANLAKNLGKFGPSKNSILMPLLGGGAAYGAMGPAAGIMGAVIVPAIGAVSKELSRRLTKGKADFADQVIKAGKNADEITKAYLNNTTKMQRSADELSQLLIKDSIDLSTASSALAREAATIAKQRRASIQGAAGGALTARGLEE